MTKRDLRLEMAERFALELDLACLSDADVIRSFEQAGLTGGSLILAHLRKGFVLPFGERVWSVLRGLDINVARVLEPLDSLDDFHRRAACQAIESSYWAELPHARARRRCA